MPQINFGRVYANELKVTQDYDQLYKSVLLENIDGVEIVYKQNTPLLMTGIFLELCGLYLMVEKGEAGFLAVMTGLGLLFGFYLTRKTSLVIHAGNLRIEESVNADTFHRAVAFVQDLERLMLRERGRELKGSDTQKLEQKHEKAVRLTEELDALGLR